MFTPEELKLLKAFPGKESMLCDMLECNIEKFCHDVLGERYIAHKREYKFGVQGFGGNTPAIDFYICCESGEILLEVKNPINAGSEMRSAIGQSLSYFSIAKRSKHNIKRNLLLTTRTSIDVCDTITELNLPIELLVLENERVMILKGIQP